MSADGTQMDIECATLISDDSNVKTQKISPKNATDGNNELNADEIDGRRVSCRKKAKAEVAKSGEGENKVGSTSTPQEKRSDKNDSSVKSKDTPKEGNNESPYKEILTRLEGAAFQSRLPFDKMTSAEDACFPEITKNGLIAQRVFLNVRNRLLHMWIENPKQQLTYENALRDIEAAFY